MRYEVLIRVYIKITVFCDITQNKIRQTPASNLLPPSSSKLKT